MPPENAPKRENQIKRFLTKKKARVMSLHDLNIK